MADAAEQTETQARERPVPQAAGIRLAEHEFQRHGLTAPEGTVPDDLENPAFWPNVANRLRPGDEVRVVDHDFQWLAYVFISFCNGLDVRAKVIMGTDLAVEGDVPDDLGSDFECKLKGPRRWCLVRKSDGEIIKEGIATKAEAEKEKEQYIQALRQ